MAPSSGITAPWTSGPMASQAGENPQAEGTSPPGLLLGITDPSRIQPTSYRSAIRDWPAIPAQPAESSVARPFQWVCVVVQGIQARSVPHLGRLDRAVPITDHGRNLRASTDIWAGVESVNSSPMGGVGQEARRSVDSTPRSLPRHFGGSCGPPHPRGASIFSLFHTEWKAVPNRHRFEACARPQ